MNLKPDPTHGPVAAARERGSPRSCLLCGGAELEVRDAFDCEEIRSAWRVFGVEFSNATWSAFDGMPAVELFRCAACGFQFWPELAGDGLFYAELEQQKATYYAPDVPEFTRTLGWAAKRGWTNVLDVGCGEGAFLDQARAAGLPGLGVELNLQAAEVCRGKGHEVHTRALADLARDPKVARFDLVTMFQVLEHVSDPVSFLSQAAEFLAPGGCLSVAVPNESGIYRLCPREPHQWPPHHVTRWRLQDLRRLGQRCGLEVAELGANRLLGIEARHFWNLHNQIGAALGQRPLPGGQVLPRILAAAYRALGLRHVVSGMGTSVYALYRRP